ncbi:MAG: T9SS type A sorting domain-containing protein [Bacteroidota bacterium]
MKYILILLTLIFITSNYVISAFLGGEINFKYISGYTYQINVTVCKTYSQQDSIEVIYGDGTTGIIGIIDSIPYNNYAIYKYQGSHTFPGSGTYTVLSSFYNWENAYSNIPNSNQIPLTLMTIIHIDAILGFNLSPICVNELWVDTAITGQFYIFNPSYYDPDGDSISYNLTDCVDIPSYTFPDTTPYFTINCTNGDIIWNTPNNTGRWAIAFSVDEWRNNVLISSIIKQMTIIVRDNTLLKDLMLDDKINIYPNPANGNFTIEAKGIKKVEIFDLQGKTIFLSNKECSILNIDISKYSKGIFLVKIQTDNGLINTKIVMN